MRSSASMVTYRRGVTLCRRQPDAQPVARVQHRMSLCTGLCNCNLFPFTCTPLTHARTRTQEVVLGISGGTGKLWPVLQPRSPSRPFCERPGRQKRLAGQLSRVFVESVQSSGPLSMSRTGWVKCWSNKPAIFFRVCRFRQPLKDALRLN